MKLAFLLLIAIACISCHQLGVRLEDLKELTFRKDIWTKNIRMPSSPQLIYAGGDARRNISQVRLVKCVNTDNDWNCTANLDPVLNFTKVSINCEGANHLDDDNILVESCYLEYNLNYFPVICLGNKTKPTNITNTTNVTILPIFETNYSFQCNGTFWPFNQLSDDPHTQQMLLLGTTFTFVVTLLICNCEKYNGDSDKKQVVDNAEDASSDSERSEESEELKM